MDYDPWWLDPTSAWQLKLARAQHHIESLAADVEAFVSGGTYEAVPEPGDQPGETIYRLRMSRPVPLHLSTVIGDALHNLRSALDCAACELARRHVGRTLTEDEERACQFPISGDPAEVARFFQERRRVALYGAEQRRAIAAVQPGWLHDIVIGHGTPAARPREEEVANDDLTLLNRLSNVDKHRRVHLAVSWPELVYWGSDDPSDQQRWYWGGRRSRTARSSAACTNCRTIPSHLRRPSTTRCSCGCSTHPRRAATTS